MLQKDLPKPNGKAAHHDVVDGHFQMSAQSLHFREMELVRRPAIHKRSHFLLIFRDDVWADVLHQGAEHVIRNNAELEWDRAAHEDPLEQVQVG